MNLHARLKSQHLPQFRLRQPLGAVSLEGQRFQSHPCRILTFRRDVSSNFVGDGKGDLHNMRLALNVEPSPAIVQILALPSPASELDSASSKERSSGAAPT